MTDVTCPTLNVASLYFNAEAEESDAFDDVRVITSASECLERASALVCQRSPKTIVSYDILTTTAERLVRHGAVTAREYVDVSEDGITVCMHVRSITDNTITEAVKRVAAALDKLNGEFGRVVTRDQIKLTSQDLDWLVDQSL